MLDSMADDRIAAELRSRVGLCADCLHARKIESERGSQFILCGLSRSDSSFAKYPRLPVLQCRGHVAHGTPTA
jgi:ABC-type molybdenum transport system ATPase subunit/photorepair protein PhrA